jgi:hypothetical protein
MEPIIVNSQLDLKKFYSINMYLLYRRKMMWYFGFICVVMIIGLLMSESSIKDDATAPWLGIFFCSFYLLVPLFTYRAVSKIYKNVKTTGEPKVYTIDENNIAIEGQTVSARTDWSNIEKVNERKNDFLAVFSAGRGVHFLPKPGFAREQDMILFKDLINAKGIKINFK